MARVHLSLVTVTTCSALLGVGQPGVGAGDPEGQGALGAAYYVSADAGSDTNAGTEARPFRTIQRAQAEMRRRIAAGMTADLAVVIRGGTYYLDAPLQFDERDGGHDGREVIYRGYPGEQAEIVGGRPVPGWVPVGEHVYAADLGPDWQPNVLAENRALATMARTPNEGYLAVGSVPTSVGQAQFTYAAGDLPERFDYGDAQVLVWAGYDELWDGGKNYNWESSLIPIAGVDFATRTITPAEPTIRDLHQHNRYYVRGALEFLDQPGEFHLDSSARRLYYWPRQTPIEAQTIEAATVPRVIEVIGSSPEAAVQDLAFEDLTLRLTNAPRAFGPSMYLACDGLLYVRNARRVTIRHCRVQQAGLAGIALDKESSDHWVTGNLIEDCAYSGVCLAGYWIGGAPYANEVAAYVNHGHTVSDNRIRRCGQLIGQASGVWLYQSGDNEISHNLIEQMPRYGVRIDGTSFSHLTAPPEHGGLGGRLFGQQVTWERRLDFVYSRNNRITHNELRACMQDSQDGGAICTYGTGAGNLIADNLVHHLRTTVTEGSIAGIYLDDASSHFTVERNIVAQLTGVRYVYPLIIKGVANTVRNNILADNEARAAIYVLQTPFGGLPAEQQVAEEPVERLRFHHNILYRNGGPGVYQLYPWKDAIIAASDYNTIYEPQGQLACVVDWQWEPWEAWTQRLGGRYERHTVLADPLFIAAEGIAGQVGGVAYQLRPESPALQLGFEPIDTSEIGPRTEFALPEAAAETAH